MIAPEWIAAGLGCVSVIFTAGAGWRVLQQSRKDLNGLGSKLGHLKDDQVRNVIIQLVLENDRKNRELIAKNWLH